MNGMELERAMTPEIKTIETSPDHEQHEQVHTDASGIQIFSRGELGKAHVMSHLLVDSGRSDLGYLKLGRWLQTQQGSGSQWMHLQFHMGIFEIETGHWQQALRRLLLEILPEATECRNALTDAPALCWRIAFAATGQPDLPWEALGKVALDHLYKTESPFTKAHHMLALAGLGDWISINRWIRQGEITGDSMQRQVLLQLARALSAYARHSYEVATNLLAGVVPRFRLLNGSQAQNGLIPQLAIHCKQQSMAEQQQVLAPTA
jgi:hypothetical protein